MVSKKLEDTKKIMAALIGMKPKPHDELTRKTKAKKAKSLKRKKKAA